MKTVVSEAFNQTFYILFSNIYLVYISKLSDHVRPIRKYQKSSICILIEKDTSLMATIPRHVSSVNPGKENSVIKKAGNSKRTLYHKLPHISNVALNEKNSFKCLEIAYIGCFITF